MIVLRIKLEFQEKNQNVEITVDSRPTATVAVPS